MATNSNKSCDNCMTIVYGRDRGAFVQKDNIFLNGQLGRNRVDPESGWRDTIYMTRSAQEQLVFCDLRCMVEWAERQVELFDNRKKARLMEEASGESMERLYRQHDRDTGRGRPAPAPATYKPPAPAPKRFGYGGEITEG